MNEETYTTDTAQLTTKPAEQPQEQPAKQSFDDVLKSDKEYQSEFDKRVNKALETQRQKLAEEAKAQADEAAKLAKMKADEKAEYERQKREEALTKREAEITRRELHAEAVTQLADKGLPASLADILDCTSADRCKASLDIVEKAFKEAVETAVNGKLRGTPPKAAAKNTEDDFLKGFGL